MERPWPFLAKASATIFPSLKTCEQVHLKLSPNCIRLYHLASILQGTPVDDLKALITPKESVSSKMLVK